MFYPLQLLLKMNISFKIIFVLFLNYLLSSIFAMILYKQQLICFEIRPFTPNLIPNFVHNIDWLNELVCSQLVLSFLFRHLHCFIVQITPTLANDIDDIIGQMQAVLKLVFVFR